MICFIATDLKCLSIEIFVFVVANIKTVVSSTLDVVRVVFAKFFFENNSHVKGTGLTQWEKAIANPKEKVG